MQGTLGLPAIEARGLPSATGGNNLWSCILTFSTASRPSTLEQFWNKPSVDNGLEIMLDPLRHSKPGEPKRKTAVSICQGKPLVAVNNQGKLNFGKLACNSAFNFHALRPRTLDIPDRVRV